MGEGGGGGLGLFEDMLEELGADGLPLGDFESDLGVGEDGVGGVGDDAMDEDEDDDDDDDGDEDSEKFFLDDDMDEDVDEDDMPQASGGVWKVCAAGESPTI